VFTCLRDGPEPDFFTFPFPNPNPGNFDETMKQIIVFIFIYFFCLKDPYLYTGDGIACFANHKYGTSSCDVNRLKLLSIPKKSPYIKVFNKIIKTSTKNRGKNLIESIKTVLRL